MTEKKINTLISLYDEHIPKSADTEAFLLEILTACEGSVKDACLILDDTLGVKGKADHDRGKRKMSGGEDKRYFKSQKSLNYFINDESKKLKPVATDTRTKTSKRAIELHTKEDIESNIKYLTYHEDVLPKELANSLLKHLMSERKGFLPYEFHLFGNKCYSNHTSKFYSSDQAIAEGKNKVYYNNRRSTVHEYDDLLKMTQILIEDLVNDTIKKFEAFPFQIVSPNWKGDVVLVNRYEKEEHLLWHSDRLTSIGPLPIIASLSLGCVREFRVRRNYPSNSQIYTLKPSHNSLIIMHAGFQEEYRHSVNQQTNFKAMNMHPISKDIRFNLTYRDYLKKYLENAPQCLKCSCPMDLRRTFKNPARRGQYMWQCSRSYSGVDCDGIRLADFNSDRLVVENGLCQGSKWLADDDLEAKQAQGHWEKLQR